MIGMEFDFVVFNIGDSFSDIYGDSIGFRVWY